MFDFASHKFYDDITDLVCEYKKLYPTNNDVLSTINENLKNNIGLLRLEKQFMPARYYDIIEKKLIELFIR
jgi:hypothetical protein